MQQMTIMIQAAEEAHVVNELPMPGYWFGILAFLGFIAMYLITSSFSSRGQSPTTADHHVDPAALPADEAELLAGYSGRGAR